MQMLDLLEIQSRSCLVKFVCKSETLSFCVSNGPQNLDRKNSTTNAKRAQKKKPNLSHNTKPYNTQTKTTNNIADETTLERKSPLLMIENAYL